MDRHLHKYMSITLCLLMGVLSFVTPVDADRGKGRGREVTGRFTFVFDEGGGGASPSPSASASPSPSASASPSPSPSPGSDLITAQSTFTIVDAPDGRKKLQKDGTDFLMYGTYWTMLSPTTTTRNKRLADVASSEGIFNFIQSPVDQSDGPFFDEAAQHGLYVMLQNNDGLGDASTINFFKTEPALAIHSPLDDVDFSGTTVQQATDKLTLVEGAYDIISHLTGNDSTSTRPPYIGIGEEINTSQIYPFNAEPFSRSWFGARNARTNDDGDGNTTLLGADLQAYDAGGGYPTADSIRAQFWSAVANGHRAFLWYALDDTSGDDWFAETAMVNEITALKADADTISSTILNATSTENRTTADAEVFFGLLDNGDETGILIVANLKEVAGSVVLNEAAIGGATGSGALTKTFNDSRYGSGLSLSSGGILTGTIAHKEIHVYNVTTPAPLSERVRYVNTASSGGDGTTNGTSGSTAAYSTLSAALTGEAANLVADNVVLVINVSGASPDTTAVAIDTSTGYTTSPDNYILVKTNAALSNSVHGNTYGAGYRHEIVDGTSRGFDIKNDIDIVIDGLSFSKDSSSTTDSAIRTQNNVNGQKVTIKNSIIKCTGSNGNAIELADAEADHTIYNNMIYDCGAGIRITKTGTNLVANNTITSNDTGVISNTGTTLTNNILQGNTAATSGTSAATTTNASSGVTFENAASDDYRLASGDTGAKDQGTDLGSTLGESIDYIRNSRSGTWDIGAHELQ